MHLWAGHQRRDQAVADGVAGGREASADTEAVLRRTRRLFINRDNMRAAIRTLVNETLAVRETALWGLGSCCASDSRKFGSWTANVMTEWHQRYRGPGIMVYWHVERRSVCIYSQVTSTTASEVASMIEGLLRHLTSAEIDRQYTDTHGASIMWTSQVDLRSLWTGRWDGCSPRCWRDRAHRER